MDVTVKRPAYQWYPGDFRRDTAVQACCFEARALWREMLDLMHDGEPYGHLTAGGVPFDVPRLARIAGVQPTKVTRWLAELEERKVFSRTEAGVIYSRRMVRDEHNRNVRAAGGSKSQGHPNVPVARPERKGRRITRRIPSARPSPDPSLDPSADPSGYPLQFASASASANQDQHPQQLPAADAALPAGEHDTSPSPDPVPAVVDPPKNGPTHPTWLQVVATEYEEKMGAGSFPWGPAGKALKPLSAHHAADVIARHLWVYLTQTEPRFVSLPKFAQTFAQWAPQPMVIDGVLTDFGERMSR